MPQPLFSHLLNLQVPQHSAPLAFISTATLQLIPNNIVTTLTFATPVNPDPPAIFQTLWDPATPGQFTIHMRGWFLMGATVLLAGPAPLTQIRLMKNATLEHVDTNASGNMSITGLIPATVGDVLTVAVLQNSGGGLNTNPLGNQPNMWILQVG
jgi:hypothetical protein